MVGLERAEGHDGSRPLLLRVGQEVLKFSRFVAAKAGPVQSSRFTQTRGPVGVNWRLARGSRGVGRWPRVTRGRSSKCIGGVLKGFGKQTKFQGLFQERISNEKTRLEPGPQVALRPPGAAAG